MDIADVVDGTAHRIQQGRAAPDIVFFLCQLDSGIQRQPVMDDLRNIVKEDCRNIRLSRLCLLLLDHGIEATDGVLFKARHRASAVQDKYQFCQILLHNNYLL